MYRKWKVWYQITGSELWVIGGEISEVFLLNSNLNFQNSTLQTQHQVGLPRIVWIQQKISTEFLARVSWSSCLVYVLPNNLSVNLLSDCRFLPDTRRDIHCDTHRDTRYDGRNLGTFSYINSQTEVFIWIISLIASVVQEQLLPVFFSFCLLYYFYIWIQ